MIAIDRFEHVEIRAAQELRAWLERHHDQDESVWLVTYKKRPGAPYVSREAVLDELIAFGWTDGVRRKLDDERTMQLISKRRAEHWARTYKDRAARLEAEGRMHAAGRAAIERSKANGMWHFLDDVDALIVPRDLARALAERVDARAHWDGFPPSSQRFVLRWIKLAKTEATRARRIAKTARLAEKGERIPGS